MKTYKYFKDSSKLNSLMLILLILAVSLIVGICILFFMVKAGYWQKSPHGDKERICEQQFNYVLEQLKEFSRQYPVLANFEKDVSIQKEFVTSEGGMYYGLYFTNNFHFSMLPAKAIDDKLPFVGINFSLRTGHYSGQAVDVAPLKSGIMIFNQVVSDDKVLEEKIYGVFNEAKNNILKWEKEQTLVDGTIKPDKRYGAGKIDQFQKQLNSENLEEKNLAIRELGEIGSEETINFLISRLKDNIKNKTGYQTSSKHFDSDPSKTGGISGGWIGIPSENKTIIEVLAQHHVEEVIALSKQAVGIIPIGEYEQEAANIAYLIYEEFGEKNEYPQNGQLVLFEPTQQQQFNNELIKNFKEEWFKNYKNLDETKRRLGQTVDEWFDRYEQNHRLGEYTIDSSSPEDAIKLFHNKFTEQQLETFTLFGSLSSLSGYASRLYITYRSGEGYWWADFNPKDGRLLFLIYIPDNFN